MKKFILIGLVAVLGWTGCGKKHPDADVKIATDMGDIYIKLYEDTPKHRDNFLKLAKEGFYDGTLFHRVIKDFMVQGGDPDSKKAGQGPLGMGGPGYTLPAEIVPTHLHRRGAVAAARMPDQMNPNWESSGSQFYIVQGQKFTKDELDQIEAMVNMTLDARARAIFDADPKNAWMNAVDPYKLAETDKDSADRLLKKMNDEYQVFRQTQPTLKYSEETRKKYMEEGGAAFLDLTYTVFGEVVEGMEVVDKIAAVQCGAMDRPVKDIKITVEVLDKK